MSENDTPEKLDDLDARLRRARDEQRRANPKAELGDVKSPMAGLGAAFRIGTELVAALIVGVGIGVLLDLWLGTKPWLMILFFFMGSAAGILNVYRAASGIGYSTGYNAPDSEAEQPDDETKI